MGNDFSKKTPEALAALAANAYTILDGSAGDYGASTVQISTLHQKELNVGAAINAQAAAIQVAKSATTAKGQAKKALVAALDSIATTVYANPEVDDTMLSAIGFSPRRSSSPRPATPVQVTGFKATPATDGSVRLAWDRGANSKNATFTIEASADGVAWTIVAATPRVSLTLDGFAPGATAYFRVTAINASVTSRPSATVGIYLPAASPAVHLRVA